ncbi:metallophosphoesterase family protein [Thermasporomyces composti]|jgi:DNA repair exonuclease SbcCD nuclease subunit|uniref:DNA repair exonuclease SbcCD nuclease subunit n=1 Tax=Thermasporomyces composti TaxID=696763 RepID=A0A3D9V6N2_THECX|nr:metallophosphoesterase [Thermasporomyces composti]REF34695.1 DNA repair exonuclease SbcCD nuclease subunit [Thermasporomyces composti]
MAITSRPGASDTVGVRFVHSSDWQLGMVRHFLGPEAQARYGQARIDAIERIGALAGEVAAAFVVVAGDVFDANQVDRHVVLRTCEALRAVPCPVLLLPGNHDSLEPGTVWTSSTLTTHLPSHVDVLSDSEPRRPTPGVEVVGFPWRTRRALTDPLAAVADLDPPADGLIRVVVGHGQVDSLAPDVDEPALIRLAPVERAIHEGRLHYLALGDRHSTTEVGTTGRIWYSGTPEPTRPEEERPGEVLVVELAGGERQACTVTPTRVGTWRLLSHVVEVDGDDDLDQLAGWLDDQPDKTRTVVRLGVRGTLSVAGLTRLETLLDAYEEVFAAVQRWGRHWDVGVFPDDAALDELPVTGPARAALEELRIATGAGDAEAANALALLHRLAGGAA